MKFRKEKGVFEENVFSNICSTHKNAPKKYPTILKFEKKKKMTCPNEYESHGQNIYSFALKQFWHEFKHQMWVAPF